MTAGTSQSKCLYEGLELPIRGTDSEQLLKKACSDPAAFAGLFRRHYDPVFRYCMHRLFDRHRAEDVTSTVFLKVVENLRTFKGDEQAFRCWLYRVATNACNQYLRKSKRRVDLLKVVAEEILAGSNDCKQPTGSEEKLALLKQTMLTLRPRYQTIITLRFFENMKLTEIAGVLGGSPGTARSQLSRALAKLRKKIKDSTAENAELAEIFD